MTDAQTRLQQLLRDYGYRMDGTTLIQRAIPHFASERVVGRFRDIHDAVERLIPTIADPEFTQRALR